MDGITHYHEDLRWVDIKYGGVSTVPSFGLLRVTGVDSDGVITVDQPNADGQDVLVNGPSELTSSFPYGTATRESPIHALYDSGDGTPAVGEVWGAGASSWKLRKAKQGFVVAGVHDGRAIVRRATV